MTEPVSDGAKVLQFLSRAQIIAAEDVRYEEVEVPEWKGVVRLRTMTGDQSARFERLSKDERDQVMPTMLALSIVDANGDRIFEDDDLVEIMKKSMRPLVALMKVVNRMNGFDEAVKKEGEKEPALVKG